MNGKMRGRIFLDFFPLEIFSKRGEGSVWREFTTDTRLPLQTVHASIRLPSLLLRVAPFPPMFLPFFSSNQPTSIPVMYYLWLSTDPRGTKPILSSTRADSELVEVIYSTPCMQTRHR